MSESLKATLGGVIFLTAIAALGVWIAKGVPNTPIIWTLRFLLPLIVIGCAALLIREARRKDLAPNFIRRFFGRPFERDGACFSIFPSARDGVFYLNIAFQNQYEKPCNLRVVAQPPVKSFTMGKRPFQGLSIDIPCPGASFGLVRVPVAIPANFQGRNLVFEVAAATQFPQGAGRLLRFKNGLRVGKANSSGLGTAALTIGLLAVGVISVSNPATMTIPLPGGVAESIPSHLQPDIHILWTPDSTREATEFDLQVAVGAPLSPVGA